ncbi:MAG: molecular chaperone DnaK, partial [Methanobacteriota archaeon]
GERAFARDNTSLGRFQLDGIPAAARGANRIEVAFSIDADGLVHATARDLATGAARRIAIRGGAVVPEEQVRAALEDFREHESEDRSRREMFALEQATMAKLAIVGGMLERAGAMVAIGDRHRIEAAASNLQRSLAGRSAEDIRTAADELDCAVYEVSRKMVTAPEIQRDADEERMT